LIAGDVVVEEEVGLLASASLSGTVRASIASVDDRAVISDNLKTACETDDVPNDEV
jgi:carbonic anhydrase/acetyltransferase-like protein (isoleucine patch superfamily)